MAKKRFDNDKEVFIDGQSQKVYKVNVVNYKPNKSKPINVKVVKDKVSLPKTLLSVFLIVLFSVGLFLLLNYFEIKDFEFTNTESYFRFFCSKALEFISITGLTFVVVFVKLFTFDKR